MNPIEAKEAFRKARTLYSQKDYAEALALFEALDKLYPGDKDILYPRACCLRKLRRYKEARTLLEQLSLRYHDERVIPLKSKMALEEEMYGEEDGEHHDGVQVVELDEPVFEPSPPGAETPPPLFPEDPDYPRLKAQAANQAPLPSRQAPPSMPSSVERRPISLDQPTSAVPQGVRRARLLLLLLGALSGFAAVALMTIAALGVRDGAFAWPYAAGAMALMAMVFLTVYGSSAIMRGRRGLATAGAVLSMLLIPIGTALGAIALTGLHSESADRWSRARRRNA